MVNGALGADWWAGLCQELGLPAEGQGEVTLELTIKRPLIRVQGTITTQLTRECVRTLETFPHPQTITVDETLSLKPLNEEADCIELEGDALDMGDYIRQQIILGLDPYPLKDGGERGGLVVDDGQSEVVAAEKNPFAVLKQLKSSAN